MAGVPLDAFFRALTPDAEFAVVDSSGGYTTNVPMNNFLGGRAWVVHEFEGKERANKPGGPARLLVPYLDFWKSAKWVNGFVLSHRTHSSFGRRLAITLTVIDGVRNSTPDCRMATSEEGRRAT